MGGVDVGFCGGPCMWDGVRAGLSEAGIEIGGIGMGDDMKDSGV